MRRCALACVIGLLVAVEGGSAPADEPRCFFGGASFGASIARGGYAGVDTFDDQLTFPPRTGSTWLDSVLTALAGLAATHPPGLDPPAHVFWVRGGSMRRRVVDRAKRTRLDDESEALL